MDIELEVLVDEIRALREDIRALTGAALTREHAANFLGIGLRTFDKLVAAGRIHPVENSPTPGQDKRCRVTFQRSELLRYLDDAQQRLSA